MIKLLTCHVENFGKLNNIDIDFSSGLTEILKENGYGKTTIAVFIKAMFFGMKSTRTTDKEMGERQHYYPFSNQKFGGNITFEKDGKIYRIERWFDKKSETGDAIKVYENGTLLLNPDDYLGENLFEIDENAFKRTLFITADQIEVGSNAKIASKLNSIVDNSTEEVNYDKAKEVLEKKQKEFKASRGDSGLISKKNQEIIELQGKINDCKKIKDALSGKYETLKVLQTQVDELKEKVNKSNQIIADIKTYEHYDYLLSDANAKKQALDRAKMVFSSGVPTEQKIIDLKEKEQEVQSQRAVVKTLENGDSESPDFIRLNGKYQSGIPSDDDFNFVLNKMARLNELKTNAQTKNSSNSSIITILCTLPIILGVILAFFNTVLGIGVAGLGVVAVIVSILTAKKGDKKELTNEIDKLKAELNEFFNKYGYLSENYDYNLSDLKHETVYFKSLMDTEVKNRGKLQGAKTQLTALENELIAMINALGFTVNGNFRTTILEIENRYNAIIIAKRDYRDSIDKADEFKLNKNLTVRPTESIKDLEQILEDNSVKTKELAKLSQEIYEDEKQAEELEVLEFKLDKAKQDLLGYKKEYEIYTKTIAFLTKAEENLLERYVAPVKDRFSFYAKYLENAINQKIHIDKDFNLSFEEYGEYHSQKHLSFGQTAMCNLCIRLALIDNMFSGNTPFVILDDPFIGLDDENFTGMKKLINDLSKDRQLIYFTCHESRKIKGE